MARPVEESPRTALRAFADNLATGLVFVSFFVTHGIAQAIAWASASRNMSWHLIFDLLGLPLVHLAGAQTDQYFILLSVPNSLIWAAALTYVVARLRARIEQSARPRKH